jgi:hypothetical protein
VRAIARTCMAASVLLWLVNRISSVDILMFFSTDAK